MFRIGIMGAGHIAVKMCGAVRLIPEAQVTAVASRSQARADRFAAEQGIPAAYGSYEEMLRQQKPDLVYIATTMNSHAELTDLCVRHGVPVLCEKAMYTCSAEAQAGFAKAEQAGVFTMEAMWSRFLPADRKAKEWLRAGLIGDLTMAEAAIGYCAPADPEGRYFNPALGGGAAYDMSVYGIELLTWMTEARPADPAVTVMRGSTGVDVS